MIKEIRLQPFCDVDNFKTKSLKPMFLETTLNFICNYGKFIKMYIQHYISIDSVIFVKIVILRIKLNY